MVERLVADRQLTPEQQEAVMSHHQLMGGRIEEALLDTQVIDEAALLKYLAGLHGTRFVSTEKLAKADIDPATLKIVPKKLVEQETVFPVLFDREQGLLSIVTPDPENTTLLQEVQLATGVRQVRALVGRPLAVRAAIGKNYHGDIHAFARLDKHAHEQFSNMLNVFERNLVSEESMNVALAEEVTRERVITEGELEREATGRFDQQSIGNQSYLETLNVLIGLIENTRADLRGHSAHVARLMSKIAERIGLSKTQISGLVMAGHLHDLGKMSAYHLTPLNASQYEGHRTAAKKSLKTPLRLMDAVALPQETRDALSCMYEQIDGKGLPGELAGKEIPLGARLLAIVDTYADLTQNPRNPFRKTLRPAEACEVLARHRGSVFDPNLVDLFKNMVTGDDLKARLLANRHRALLVDADPEEARILEMRLLEQGFEVEIARTSSPALKALEKGDVDIVVSEIDLKPSDGLTLLDQARQGDQAEIPWVFITADGGSELAQRAFELGAADYMAKPVSAALVVAKLKQLIERRQRGPGGRGVSGSLTEMGLPEIVQVLWHGRKSGSLKIRSGRDNGEIHFVEGAIYNALFGNLRGAEAFYGMLKLQSGDFVLDPNFRAPQQVVTESPEALLLEGMRRLDEELV